MPDTEEVIRGLEKVWEAFDHMEHELYADYVFDALSLLKEREAVMPRISVEQRCGNCNKVIEMDGWKACPWCGKQIDWEGWWRKNGRNREIVDGNQVSSRR